MKKSVIFLSLSTCVNPIYTSQEFSLQTLTKAIVLSDRETFENELEIIKSLNHALLEFEKQKVFLMNLSETIFRESWDHHHKLSERLGWSTSDTQTMLGLVGFMGGISISAIAFLLTSKEGIEWSGKQNWTKNQLGFFGMLGMAAGGLISVLGFSTLWKAYYNSYKSVQKIYDAEFIVLRLKKMCSDS